VWIVLINTLALVVAVLVLWKARTLVEWILVALLLALALEPPVEWLVRRRFKRGWAVLTVFLVLTVVLLGVIAMFVPVAVTQGQALVAQFPELMERIQASAPVRWAEDHFQLVTKLKATVHEGAGDVAAPALAVAGRVIEAISAIIGVIVLTIFMLLFGADVVEQLLAWWPPDRRRRAQNLANKMQKVVGGYVAGTLLVASVGGVVMGTTLAILGVPYFLPLGLLMVVFGIVPVLGSTVGAVLLVGLTFAFQGTTAGFVSLGVYLVYQQIENHVLQPVVQRRTLKMNPLLITLSLLAGTLIAGILGALLALPIAGALQVVLQDVLQRRQARQAKNGILTVPGERS
jgi:predicted PurR-regulated permease PerM